MKATMTVTTPSTAATATTTPKADTSSLLPTLLDARRLVVKIGSALLVDSATGRMRREWLDGLSDHLATGRQAGQGVVA
ncbi:glutamate 5-kinase, partial [Azospirillum brasilense]|nr:glutamate 5-kinase [Azospirillum brasilense]